MTCYRCKAWPCTCHDGITIIHGDCREILPLLEPVDLVATDPPYNCGKEYDGYDDNLPQGEYEAFMEVVAAESHRLTEAQAWVAPRYQLPFWLHLFPKAHLIVIRRGAMGPYRGSGWSDQFEIALAEGKTNHVTVDLWEDIRLKGEGYFFREETYGHPGYTPAPILKRFISLLSSEGGTVLDPFGGTGTTGRVAKDLGRKAILIEQSERYCEIAAKRLAQEVLQ